MEAKKKYFMRGEDAVREAIKFIKECLELGGIPHVRVKYAGMPIREPRGRGVMLVCYGRAEYLPSEWVFAPGSERKWYDFVRTAEGYTGDYKILLEKFGKVVTDKEIERELRERFGEKLEEIRKMPIYGRA